MIRLKYCHLKGRIVTPIDAEPLSSVPSVDAVVLDGPVLVHQIKPVKNRSVDHYAEEIVYPYLTKYRSSANADRVDVVFDTYPSISLKGITREK